jgi:hypothetical protein
MNHAPQKRTALDAFLAEKAEVDALLARLTRVSADHFCAHPDAVHWGHVGSLCRARELLQEALRDY